jgi:hypothetical protein
MPISDLTVYVIGHPEGHTTVRTTSIQRWLDTLSPGHGYTQTPATINWKAQRTIAAMYAAAQAAEAKGEAPDDGAEGPTTAERVRAFLETLHDLDRNGLRRVAYEALMLADGPDRIDGDVVGDGVSVVGDGVSVLVLGEQYYVVSRNPADDR